MEPENETDMVGLYTRICELLNRHDVPDAPWKPIFAAIAVAVCFGTAAYHIVKLVLLIF